MKERYLEVTYRHGRPLAAYLYLPRAVGVKSARTVDAGAGLLVDYAASGEPIGIELTSPRSVTLDTLNGVLSALGASALTAEDIAPFATAA